MAEDWERLTFRVHRSAYRSPEVFRAERERIWMTSWLYLGHETEIPNLNDYKVRVRRPASRSSSCATHRAWCGCG